MGGIIGLTGGIACGKSAVADMLARRGAIVIDADQIARDVVAPGTPGLAAVIEAFGSDLLDATAALDRARLASQIFADPRARARLEGIVHPLIAQESQRRLIAAQAATPPLVVYDAALLVEAGRADAFRPLVVVVVDRATQRARLMARDRLDEAAAEARLASQMPANEKAAFADHLVDNSGTLAHTEAQVERLWALLIGDR